MNTGQGEARRVLRAASRPAATLPPVYASWQGARKMSAAELRGLQLAFGMTQVELAQYLDVDVRSISRYMADKAVIPVPVALLLRALYYYDLAPWQPDKENAGGTPTE